MKKCLETLIIGITYLSYTVKERRRDTEKGEFLKATDVRTVTGTDENFPVLNQDMALKGSTAPD